MLYYILAMNDDQTETDGCLEAALKTGKRIAIYEHLCVSVVSGQRLDESQKELIDLECGLQLHGKQ